MRRQAPNALRGLRSVFMDGRRRGDGALLLAVLFDFFDALDFITVDPDFPAAFFVGNEAVVIHIRLVGCRYCASVAHCDFGRW